MFWSRPYINPVTVGKACANQLYAIQKEEEWKENERKLINNIISNNSISFDNQALFNKLLGYLGISIEYFNGHGLKVLTTTTDQQVSNKLSKLMNYINNDTKQNVIYSIYSDDELEKMKTRLYVDSSIINELLCWRKQYPNGTKIMNVKHDVE